MPRLVLLGAGGHGAVVADAAMRGGRREVVFADDRWPEVSSLGPWPVLGTIADVLGCLAETDEVFVSIGDNEIRLRQYLALERERVRLVSIVHPSAVVSSLARVASGCFVAAGVILGPFSSAGPACLMNTAATVDHDGHLGSGVHIGPGAHLGGNVSVGERSWIGIGASVRQGIQIGADVIVGAGAAVVSNIADGQVVLGVPAKPVVST